MGKARDYLSWFVTRPTTTKKRELTWLDMHQQAGDPEPSDMYYTKEGLSPLEKTIVIAIIAGTLIAAGLYQYHSKKTYSERPKTQELAYFACSD